MSATTNPALASAKLIDPKAVMSIRSLELRARAVVEGFWSGMHRSPWNSIRRKCWRGIWATR